MNIQTCPKCKSHDITLDAAGQTGEYICKKCGYIGPLIVEKEVEVKEEEIKKDRTFLYSSIFVITLLVVLASILFGVKLFTPPTMEDYIQEILEKGTTEHGYMYQGYAFVNYENLWHTQKQVGDNLYNLHFHYSPAEVDVYVPVEGIGLSPDLDKSKFYITIDPLEENISLIALASSELNLNLVKGLGVKTTTACYRNETEACSNREIITCDNTGDAVIFVKTAEETKVFLNYNCIIIRGQGNDLLKAVDKVLFNLYGIIPYEPNLESP